MNYIKNLRGALEAIAKIRAVMANRFPKGCGFMQLEDSFSGQIRPRITIYMPDSIGTDVGHEIRRAAGVAKIDKGFKPYGTVDLLWTGETKHFSLSIKFYNVCTIIGYEKKTIPAEPKTVIPAVPEKVLEAKPERVEEVPIWDCTSVQDATKKDTADA